MLVAEPVVLVEVPVVLAEELVVLVEELVVLAEVQAVELLEARAQQEQLEQQVAQE